MNPHALKKAGLGLLHRVAETGRAPLTVQVDGRPVQALAGDTVLTAILQHQAALRNNEFSGQPRAGFCQMGACQDCWVRTPEGRRLRACTTLVSPGLSVLTHAEESPL